MMAQKDSPPVFDTWSRTTLNPIKFSHKWTIENFSFHCKKPLGTFLDSTTFSADANPEIKWFLKIYPSGEDENDKDYLSLYLFCRKDDTSKVMIKFNFYIIDVNNSMKKRTEEGGYTFEKPRTGYGYPKFIEKKLLLREANVLLPDDKLTIGCKIEILSKIVNISGKREPIQIELSEPQINNDLWLSFENHRFSDVTLVVSGKDIHAHKMILAARSPVFSAMFEHNMQEQKTNRVKIDDIDHKVFMEMLKFIYTDTAPNVEEMPLDLLAAADKYDLNRLKDMCAEALYKSLDQKNVVDILIVSHLHNAKRLKDLAITFFCEHANNVMKTESFNSMARMHTELMIEIMQAVVTRDSGAKSVIAKKKKTQ